MKINIKSGITIFKPIGEIKYQIDLLPTLLY